MVTLFWFTVKARLHNRKSYFPKDRTKVPKFLKLFDLPCYALKNLPIGIVPRNIQIIHVRDIISLWSFKPQPFSLIICNEIFDTDGIMWVGASHDIYSVSILWTWANDSFIDNWYRGELHQKQTNLDIVIWLTEMTK